MFNAVVTLRDSVDYLTFYLFFFQVLHVVFDIISEFPVLQNKNYHLRINHMCLLKAVLLHCGIAEELHNEVLVILSDTKVSDWL